MNTRLPEITTTRLYDQVSHVHPYGVADNRIGVVVLLEHLPPNSPRMTKASINSIYEGDNPVFVKDGSWQPAHAAVVDSAVAKVEVHAPYLTSAKEQAALASAVGQSAILLHRATTEVISTGGGLSTSAKQQNTERT